MPRLRPHPGHPPRGRRDDGPLPSVRPVAVARAVDPTPPPPRQASRLRADEEETAPSDLRDIPNHGDGRLPADADFFAAAPRVLGPLRAAWTTLREGKQPLNPALRVLLILAVGVGGLLLGGGIVMVCEPEDFWVVVIPVGAALIGALIAWAATRFNHTCTYVGRDGVARFVCSGSRESDDQGGVPFPRGGGRANRPDPLLSQRRLPEHQLRLYLVRRGRPQALHHHRRPQQPQ